MVHVDLIEPDAGSCVQCTATKRRMNKMGIGFSTFKASEKRDLIQELGVMQAPLVFVQGEGIKQFWTGFQPDKIKELGKMLNIA